MIQVATEGTEGKNTDSKKRLAVFMISSVNSVASFEGIFGKQILKGMKANE